MENETRMHNKTTPNLTELKKSKIRLKIGAVFGFTCDLVSETVFTDSSTAGIAI